jgi:hypothetical protein
VKKWLPLLVGGALLAALAAVELSRPPRQPRPEAPAVQPSARHEARSLQPPPAGESARDARLRSQIQLALASRDAARTATVASLKKERDAARAVISAMIRKATNPEYMRQLDLLDSEIEAP